MEFVHSRTHGTIKRSFDITDGPVMAHPSSATGKKIRITHCSIVFRRNGDVWEVDGWTGLSISGVVLKKDGTEGRETWGGSVHYSWEKRAEYNWLRTLIEATRPEGVLTLPMRVTAIETDDLEDRA